MILQACVFLRFLRGFCSNKQQGARYCWRANPSMRVQNSKSFSIQGPRYIFYNIIMLELRSISSAFIEWSRLDFEFDWFGMLGVCVVCIDRDRQHCGRAMTFLLGGGYVLSFWQAASFLYLSIALYNYNFMCLKFEPSFCRNQLSSSRFSKPQ